MLLKNWYARFYSLFLSLRCIWCQQTCLSITSSNKNARRTQEVVKKITILLLFYSFRAIFDSFYFSTTYEYVAWRVQIRMCVLCCLMLFIFIVSLPLSLSLSLSSLLFFCSFWNVCCLRLQFSISIYNFFYSLIIWNVDRIT